MPVAETGTGTAAGAGVVAAAGPGQTSELWESLPQAPQMSSRGESEYARLHATGGR